MEEFARHWQRPSSSGPKIWLRQNGFVVRDVTPDLDKFVLQHMLDNFALDAPMFTSMGITSEPNSLADMIWVWRDLLLPQRLSLVALAEGTPGADLSPVSDENPPQVLGANILSVNSDTDKQPPIIDLAKGAAFKRLFTAMKLFTSSINVFEKYGVEHVMDATGLSVGRGSRGKGLGQMLLQARLEMCRGLGIPLTRTFFTAVGSQKCAAKVGFTIVSEIPFPEILDENGAKYFPDLQHTMQLCIYKL